MFTYINNVIFLSHNFNIRNVKMHSSQHLSSSNILWILFTVCWGDSWNTLKGCMQGNMVWSAIWKIYKSINCQERSQAVYQALRASLVLLKPESLGYSNLNPFLFCYIPTTLTIFPEYFSLHGLVPMILKKGLWACIK